MHASMQVMTSTPLSMTPIAPLPPAPRQAHCRPKQIFITVGVSSLLALALYAFGTAFPQNAARPLLSKLPRNIECRLDVWLSKESGSCPHPLTKFCRMKNKNSPLARFSKRAECKVHTDSFIIAYAQGSERPPRCATSVAPRNVAIKAPRPNSAIQLRG